MTTIQFKPMRGARVSDCSTFDYFPGNARVIPSITFPLTGSAVDVIRVVGFEAHPNLLHDLSKTKWGIPTLQRMAALPWRTANWTTGGKRTQPSAAADLLGILFRVLDNQAPAPSIVPTWRGGVQAEWHRNNVDLEIEANPGEEIEYFLKSPTVEHEGRAWEELNQLSGYARQVI